MPSRKQLVLMTLCSIVMLLLLFACNEGDSDDSQIDGDGTACSNDSECGVGTLCSTDGICEACDSCNVRQDCDSGYDCIQPNYCCRKIECNTDAECAEPWYCIEDRCKEKSCTEPADCTRSGHTCLNGVCIKKECDDHSQCESKLCDLDTYTCKDCMFDTDCPKENQYCSNDGICVSNLDGDSEGQVGDLQQCPEFKESCLYETLSCFDKGYPDAASYLQCSHYTDDLDRPVYLFEFPDGSTWKMIGQAGNLSYEATGINSEDTAVFCYRMYVDAASGYNVYTDRDGNELGRTKLVMDESPEYYEVVCEDGSKEWFDVDKLMVPYCDGYPHSGVYIPPSDQGFEQCVEVKR